MDYPYNLDMYFKEVLNDASAFLKRHGGEYKTFDSAVDSMMTSKEVCCHSSGLPHPDDERSAEVMTAHMRWDDEFVHESFPAEMGRGIDLTSALEFDADVRRYCLSLMLDDIRPAWAKSGNRRNRRDNARAAGGWRIGKPVVDGIEDLAARLLWLDGHAREIDSFKQGTEVYTLCGEAVTTDVWDDFWSGYPEWYEKVYMVADNGMYNAAQVGDMTLEEVEAAYEACPCEYVYYTTV